MSGTDEIIQVMTFKGEHITFAYIDTCVPDITWPRNESNEAVKTLSSIIHITIQRSSTI